MTIASRLVNSPNQLLLQLPDLGKPGLHSFGRIEEDEEEEILPKEVDTKKGEGGTFQCLFFKGGRGQQHFPTNNALLIITSD